MSALSPARSRPRAVLFDRDGTLVIDVPYNGNPELVEPVPHARQIVAALRAAGVKVGVITNQSGIARGIIDREQAEAVNARIDREIGPFDDWRICPHAAEDGCRCRKPEPGMVLDAASALGVLPHEVAVIGDIGADVSAAEAAGARGVLVPTAQTRSQEVADAAETAVDLTDAVAVLFGDGVRVPAPDRLGA